jgi:YHYH protein/Secretion system C-terminal sorting domain
MTRIFLLATLLLVSVLCNAHNVCHAQTNPAITSWLRNTTRTGTYYVSGNSTAISNGILVNCQSVEYSANSVYVRATGVPAHPTGPFLDRNPSNATNQNAIFQFPLNPVKNMGTPTATSGNNIGVFINGVALFDYRDGVAWNASTNSLCGGPGNSPCAGGVNAAQPWNRDAIIAERAGFDCAKAHPAMGNYHYHQNPSAFKLDLNVLSTICNLYDAEGLYAIDSTKHSPLIGFAYDGFPIYGAYGYKNLDGTGGIVRIKSSYQLRNITKRTTSPTGAAVTSGPDVSATYPLGYFREDYELIPRAGQNDYLDEHNGRFCVTPEYPRGIYCYFATVDAKWNSAYPYVVGPTYYGVFANRKVASIAETTTKFNGTSSVHAQSNEAFGVSIYPNPSNEFIAVQIVGLNTEDVKVELLDMTGKVVQKTTLLQGTTMTYIDTRTLYSGSYIVKMSGTNGTTTKKIVLSK